MNRSRLYLGQKIMVAALPDGELFKSMIQELEDKKLAITLPVRGGQYLLLHEGDKVRVEFVLEDAVYSFVGEILERKKVNNVSLLVLPRPAVLSRRQRRQYVRLQVVMPLQIRTDKGKAADGSEKVIRGKVLDLSGGGLQFASDEALPVNTEVTLTLPLDDGKKPLVTKGVVSWVIVDRATKTVRTGVQFTGIREADRERIIAYIFRELRKRIPPP